MRGAAASYQDLCVGDRLPPPVGTLDLLAALARSTIGTKCGVKEIITQTTAKICTPNGSVAYKSDRICMAIVLLLFCRLTNQASAAAGRLSLGLYCPSLYVCGAAEAAAIQTVQEQVNDAH